ncbi:MAG: AAA family ATPase [Planctomycetota bacterium]|nr:AAA family ATPase [Planctomycetota bacterium]
MYESYWELPETPFDNSVDARWFYESEAHEEALARLFFLIEQYRRCGFLSGPSGTGKSLLLQLLTREVRRTQRDVAFVDLYGLSAPEALWKFAAALDLAPDQNVSVRNLWRTIEDHLEGSRLSQNQTVAVFDHLDQADSDCAQLLSRLINYDGGASRWLTVIAACRDLNLPRHMDDIRDRVDLRVELQPLTQEHTAKYVQETLRKAGCRRTIFADDALDNVFELTKGIPRQINRVCDLSLLAGMGEQKQTIDASVVDSAVHELEAAI